MPIEISGTTGITFPDNTFQSTASTPGIGVGQTWQLVSRTLNVNYTNTTGKSIMLAARADRTGASSAGLNLVINNVSLMLCYNTNSGGGNTTAGSLIIPPGAVYQLQVNSEPLSSYQVWELR